MANYKNLFSKDIEFIAGANDSKIFPKQDFLPEIAFIGRSNVGKSSLLNALVGKKNLARVSNSPGRTRQANFFSLSQKMLIVDLPGYGYAKVSKKEARSWNQLFLDYIKLRPNLKIVFVLIDLRRGLMNLDLEVIDLLEENEVPYFLVGTKFDKLSKKEITENIAGLKEDLGEDFEDSFIMTSSTKKTGIAELQKLILNNI